MAGIALGNPIGLAAGFDKTCKHLDSLGRLGFGYVVGGTITFDPRRGNGKPRIVRLKDRGSLVNSMGLPNPGAVVAAHDLSRTARVVPRVISLADESSPSAIRAFELLESHGDAFELNASCPNVSWGRDQDNEAHLEELLGAFRERSDKPVFVKVPPFYSQVERDVVLALAGISQEAGAAGITCANTRPVVEPRLQAGAGGLSGRDLTSETPRMVREIREATGGEIVINACGGIFTAADALACLEAGARTVQIYTGMIYEGPGLVGDMTGALSELLDQRDLDLADLSKGPTE